jgi:hypothetical protein
MDIFLWLSFADRSVPNALVASRLYGAMSRARVLRAHGHFLETTVKMARMARKFESRAHGIVEECHAESPAMTRAMLRAPLRHFRLVCRPHASL